MPGSFTEDLEYLGKILLITFILLSLVVLYNQKILEGIIMISFCFQILLLWLMVQKFDLSSDLPKIFPVERSKKNIKYLLIIVMGVLFVLSISLIFRAIALVQHSLENYGMIKSDYTYDILLASILGIIILVIFFVQLFLSRRYLKKKINIIQFVS